MHNNNVCFQWARTVFSGSWPAKWRQRIRRGSPALHVSVNTHTHTFSSRHMSHFLTHYAGNMSRPGS